MKIRKLLSAILACAMLLALTACGGGNAQGNGSGRSQE